MPDNSAAPNTVPVIAPDGTKWDIPHDQVPAAVQNGGKLGVDMLGPDSKPYLIPMDNVHAAIAGGGRLAPPPLSVGSPSSINPASPANPNVPGSYQMGDEVGPNTQGAGQYEKTVDTRPMVKAMGEEAVSMGKGVLTAGLPQAGIDVYQKLQELPVTFRAYENARQSGKGVMDSLSAANDAQKKIDDAKNVLQQRIKEFSTNPDKATGRAIVDLVPVILGAGLEAPPASIAPMEGSEAAAEAASAPATHVYNEVTGKLTPIESAVSKAVAKSGLPEGQAPSVAPTGESIQPTLQQGLRDTMSKVARENGVAPSTAPSIRDVVKETADNIYAKSKSQFGVLDEATGGNVSRFDEQIRNVNRALQNVTDDAEEAKLLARKSSLEASQEGAFEEAKAKGVDPRLVDDAKANYKKAQALYDVDNHVKMSTSGTRPNIGKPGAQTPEIVDPKKLSSRLNKVYDSGRLQDAAGEDNAQALLTHADNAQVAGQQIKEFVPTSPTGQKAMQNILTPNTKGKLIGSGANTDFRAVW
jgi:hypothetical protein